MTEYIVLFTWDDEASVWVAENDDIPIALESPSLDTLMERVKLAAPELLELNDKNHGGFFFTTNLTNKHEQE